MKTKSNKIVSLLLSLCLVLGAFFCVPFTIATAAQYSKEYTYPAGTLFIKDIATCYFKDENEGKNNIRNAGCTLVDKDLTRGCDGDYYVFMGYRTTTNPAEAIRGIRLEDYGDHPYSYTQSGATWYRANSGDPASIVPKLTGDGFHDLHKGSGGRTFHLYVTKTPEFGPPLTLIDVTEGENTRYKNSTGWTDVVTLQNNNDVMDLNRDCPDTAYLYMHYYTPCTKVDTTTLRSLYTNSASYAASSNYTTATKNTLNSARTAALNIMNAFDNNQGCASYTQSAINAAANNIQSALNGLKTTLTLNATVNGGTTTTPTVYPTIGTNSTTAVNLGSYTATKSGWSFLGWSKDSAAATGVKNTQNIGFNETWYAIYSKTINCTFNYLDANGALQTTAKSNTIYNTSTTASFPAPPMSTTVNYDGRTFTFAGWRTDANAAAPSTTNNRVTVTAAQGAATYYAVYTAPITFTQDANKGTPTVPTQTQTQYLTASSSMNRSSHSFTVTSVQPTRTGGVFLGWADSSEATAAAYQAGKVFSLKSDKTIYAAFKLQEFSVKFYAENGTLLSNQTVKYGYNATPPAAQTKAYDGLYHYTFNGWQNYTNVTSNRNITASFTAVAHNYSITHITEPNCTETGSDFYTCQCGYQKTVTVSAKGHSLAVLSGMPATCTASGIKDKIYCINCDYVEQNADAIAPLGHDYQYSETVAATCSNEGYDIYVCSRDAAHTERRNIVAPNANHPAQVIPAVAATCTSNGKTKGSICSLCGAILTQPDTIIAEGHKWVDIAAKAPTCTEDGNTAGRYCSVCGKVALASAAIPMTGHNFVAVEAKDATCTEDGNTAGERCTNCGELRGAELIPATGHSMPAEPVVVPSTCKTHGTSTYECTVCHETVVEELPLAEHTSETVPAVEASCSAYGWSEYTKCSVCGVDLTVPERIDKKAHSFETVAEAVAATCGADGKTAQLRCTVCAYEEAAQTVPATGHSFGMWIVTTPATCTTDGEETRYCKACTAFETRVITAAGHNYEISEQKAATCTENGETAGVKCTVCGDIQSGCEVIEATGHSMSAQPVVIPATCSAEGSETYYCENCDYTKVNVLAKTAHTEEIIPATAATCTRVGKSEGKRCTVCGEITVAPKSTGLAEHQPVPYGTAVAATCEMGGHNQGSMCAVCGKLFSVEKDTNALGHDYSDWTLETAPGCESTGLKVRVCSLCGNRDEIIVPALGHDWGEWVYTVATSCTMPAQKECRCTRCSAVETQTEAPLGHSAIAVAEIPATCETAGKTEGTVCALCNAVVSGCEEIAPLGHNYTATTVTAGCVTEGCTLYTCSNDPTHSYKENIVPATGHSGGTATCTQKAVCEVCGREYGDTLPHSYTAVVTPATCTAKGYTTYICACGDSYTADETEITEHSYTDVKVITPATCTTEGEKLVRCTVCADEKTVAIAPAGHQVDKWELSGDKAIGTCTVCGETVELDADDPAVELEPCERCGYTHTRSTGIFKYRGLYCSIVYMFRSIANFFKNLF